jgi:LysM repeat protein
MQKINYKEKISLEENINELLLINIDDKLNQTSDGDCLKISGEIKISGEVNTNSGKKDFNHPVSVDILLSKEQIVDTNINVIIDDFNYEIFENHIVIDLVMKIEGLKEIEAYFPPQEAQEDFQIEESIEQEEALFNEPIIDIQEEILINDLPTIKNKNSLLHQIFRNKSFKREVSHLFHVVKKDSTYQDIANEYNVDLDLLRKVNKDEEIYIGKLIFIPKNQ